MLDLELLKALLCVVDERSFTRAAAQVHRTQSTVSQQIRKLEDSVGHVLLLRDRTGNQVTPTEHGEVLAQYARRLLALSQEAEDMMASPATLAPVRLGVPEDFDAQRMATMLSGFMATQPGVRLETVSGMSVELQRKLSAGEIELALLKREPGAGACLASWPESLVWVAGAHTGVGCGSGGGESGVAQGARQDRAQPVPLALFPQGCVYRLRAIRSLEQARQPWRIAFGSHSLTGIQAAVSAGLGVTVLPRTAVLPGHRLLTPDEGYAPVPPTELALIAGTSALGQAHRALADYLETTISAWCPPAPG